MPFSLPPVHRVTPLRVEQFAAELCNHLDQSWVAYVLDGLHFGFKLGFTLGPRLKLATPNKPSALSHSRVVTEYLANEVFLGRVAGRIDSPPLFRWQISTFGVIPRKGQPGKRRLIVDLSSPGESSVNDGIEAERFPLQNIRIDDVIRKVAKHGADALTAKFDMDAVYRNIPVHPDDRFLRGLKRSGQFFLDLVLLLACVPPHSFLTRFLL